MCIYIHLSYRFPFSGELWLMRPPKVLSVSPWEHSTLGNSPRVLGGGEGYLWKKPSIAAGRWEEKTKWGEKEEGGRKGQGIGKGGGCDLLREGGMVLSACPSSWPHLSSSGTKLSRSRSDIGPACFPKCPWRSPPQLQKNSCHEIWALWRAV